MGSVESAGASDDDGRTCGPPTVDLPEYGKISTAHESPRELATLFREVEEYFEAGATVARGATIVDVGANIGAFAVATAKRAERDLSLWCFEPVPDLYTALSQNLAENVWLKPGRHRAHNVALSTPEESGTPCEFYYFRRFPRDSTMDLVGKRAEFDAFFAAQGARARASMRWLGPGARLIETAIASVSKGAIGHWLSDKATGLERLQVPRNTLSGALEGAGVSRIDLLKVDVEGAELKVLGGIDDRTWGTIQQAVIETDGSEDRTRAIVELAKARDLPHVRVFAPPSTQERGLPNVIVLASRADL